MPELLPLHLLPSGYCARIDQLWGHADQVHRLEELGLRVGSQVEMVRAGCPCIVRLNGARLAFRDSEAVSILVRLGDGS